MKKTIRKIWNVITNLLVIFVVFFAILTIGVRLVGLEPYVVLSGSMEPVFQTGSVIYVKDTDAEELQAGDIITFWLNKDTVATHRIIEVTEKNGETAFRTKGDANDVADGSAVYASQVIGTPIFTIPYVGYLMSYIQTTSGRYAVITAGAVLVLLMILPYMIFGKEKKDSEDAK